MKSYRVKVIIRVLEIYEVQAGSSDEAADDWGLGELIDADDEALESEVVSVEEVQP